MIILFCTERMKVGSITKGVIAVKEKGQMIKQYDGPMQVMREVTEEEFIKYNIEKTGKIPKRVNNNKCYYYEVSID